MTVSTGEQQQCSADRCGKAEVFFELNRQHNEQSGASISCCSGGLGPSLRSLHKASERFFLQVLSTRSQRLFTKSNVLLCQAKPLKICPLHLILQIPPLSDALSLDLLGNTLSLQFVNPYYHFSSLYLCFLCVLHPSSPSFHSLSFFSLSVSQGTGALCTIVMATAMGRQDGGVIAGLASFYKGRS